MKKLLLLLCLFLPLVLQAQCGAAQNDNRLEGVPAEVIAWIESETAKPTTPTVTDLHSPAEFFANTQNARLVGYFKGYNLSSQITAGKITHYNMITGEDLISVLEIEPDGRFTADVQLVTPAMPMINLGRFSFQLYLEPGQTLGVILEFKDIASEPFRSAVFYGPLAGVNDEIARHDELFKNQNIDRSGETQGFKKMQLANWKSQSDELDNLIRTNAVSPKAGDILRSKITTSNVFALLDHIYMLKSRNRDNEEVLQKIDSTMRNGYFDFMRDDFMNDPALLIQNSAYALINRCEFIEPSYLVVNILRNPLPEISFYDYLTKELKDKTKLEPDEAEHYKHNFLKEAFSYSNLSKTIACIREYRTKAAELSDRFIKEKADYREKYTPAPAPELEVFKAIFRHRDSTMKNVFRLKPNLIQDIVKMRDIKSNMERQSKEDVRAILDYAASEFTSPYIIPWGEELYYKKFPAEGTDTTYELPEGKAADIFKRIIDPLRGKLLIVDFWGVHCGPCVGAIQHSKTVREEFKDDDRIAFVFITDDKYWSPQEEPYNKLVEDNSLTNSHRLSNNDWNHLSQLFSINGIPHYALITPDGKVAEMRFQPNMTSQYLDNLIKKYFPDEE